MASPITSHPASVRVLIVNPNTSTSMTQALHPVIAALGYQDVTFGYFTCPPDAGSIPSINSPADAAKSAEICLPHVLELLGQYDAFLVACYSEHPLVPLLKRACLTHVSKSGRPQHVTGIFEASVLASLTHVGSGDASGAWGIVSTGAVWEKALAEAVDNFLGLTQVGGGRFVGCETTGLNASELHDMDPSEVRKRMKAATERLFVRARKSQRRLGAICLGCAGMVGLEETVREVIREQVGAERTAEVMIVDGVRCGVGQLISMVRGAL